MNFRTAFRAIFVAAILLRITLPIAASTILDNNGSPNQSDGANITGF
jgi:hypothetical protein